MSNLKICSINGCGKRHAARGWCFAHWARWRRHGDPLGGGVSRGTPVQFLERAKVYDGDDCLSWPFATLSNGYGSIRFNGKSQLASRIMCENVNGAPPTSEHEAAHSCGNGHLGCITPKHLRWATHIENEGDKLTHGTRPRGETIGNSKLTEPEVREIRALAWSITQQDIADAFGVSVGHVNAIIHRKVWKHLT